MAQLSAGLRDVEAVESSVSTIAPEGLFYRGIPLDAILGRATYEEVAFLLWNDRRPASGELSAVRQAYVKAWTLTPETVAAINAVPGGVEPLWSLQAALPLLGVADGERDDMSAAAEQRRAIRILGQVGAALACRYWRIPVKNLDPNSSLASQVLRALGSRPLPAAVADAALILYADHELAASTFAARVAAAARSGLYDGLSAAVAVLKGPLHGGSTLEVAALLRGLADSRSLESAVSLALAPGRRLPGFGHSVYKEADPRAAHFRRLAEQIAVGEARRWLDAAMMLERRVAAEQNLYANVDLYAVAFMHAAGLKDSFMLAMFAVARTAGWLAHMIEQHQNNRLIRPRARYTGILQREWDT